MSVATIEAASAMRLRQIVGLGGCRSRGGSHITMQRRSRFTCSGRRLLGGR
jgi:hypothetical protein